MAGRALWLAAAIVVATHASGRSESADGLRAALERFLGHGALTVTPDGGAFRVAVDLHALAGGLERFGVTLDPATYAVTLTPGDDGLWQVASDGFPPVTARFNGQTVAVVSNNGSFAGRYDPRIPAFTGWTGRYASLSVGVTAPDGATQSRLLTGGEQSYAATTAGDGVIDAKLTQHNASYAQDLALRGGTAPIDITVKSGGTGSTVDVAGLRIRALTELWAFFVAHPSADAVKADQAALRALLRGALPVFSRFTQDDTLDDLSVTSPIGIVRAAHARTHVAVAGLTEDGALDVSLAADGLSLPTAALPPWTAALLPTAIALDTALSGYHLDAAAKTLIDTFDLQRPDPIPPDTRDAVGPMLGNPQSVRVTIGDSRIATPTIDLRFGGTIVPAPPSPRVELTLHATGLDKAIAAVSEASKTDPSARQALAGLLVVKGYGRAEADGALTWVVTLDADRVVTINGVPLPTANRN